MWNAIYSIIQIVAVEKLRNYELIPTRNIPKNIDRFVVDNKAINAPSLYALQIAYRVDEPEFQFNDNDKLVFSIRAVLPYSGTYTYKTVEYSSENIVHDAKFKTGNNIGYDKL